MVVAHVPVDFLPPRAPLPRGAFFQAQCVGNKIWPTEARCVAWKFVANDCFERWDRFEGIQPNSGLGDCPRLSSGVGKRSSSRLQDHAGNACAYVGHRSASLRERARNPQHHCSVWRWTFLAKKGVADYPIKQPHRFPGPSQILSASCLSRGWSFRRHRPSARPSREPSPEFELAP